MPPPQPRLPPRHHWLARRASAWITCLAVLTGFTCAALRAVEGAAHRALTDWCARREAMSGTPAPSIPLVDGVIVKQRLPDRQAASGGDRAPRGIRVATVSPHGNPEGITWRLVRLAGADGTNTLVHSGTLGTTDIDAAGWIHIEFPPLTTPPSDRLLLKLCAPPGPAVNPSSLAVHHTHLPCAPPLVSAGPTTVHPPAQPLPGTCLALRVIDGDQVTEATAVGGLP